jgi:hypothetical protein
MARGLLLSLMLFVLLWTGTLLHDIAEIDQPVAVQQANTDTFIGRITQSVSNEEFATEDHFHVALLRSRFNLADLHLLAPKLLAAVSNSVWTEQLQLSARQQGQRAPPAIGSAARPKLYLINRVLLI